MNLGKYFGVPLKFHWSALALYVAALPTWAFWTAGFWTAALAISSVFACVAAHEYGHVRMGQALGYETDKVYLWAGGGIANFKDIPQGGRSEFWISVAGPAVNIGLALLVFAAMGAFGAEPPTEFKRNPLTFLPTDLEFWLFFGAWNVLMAGFNLLPMFPSDGGRVLRSLLSRVVSLKTATGVASTLGFLAGSALVVYGAFSFNLIMIAVGIFLGGAAVGEYKSVS